MVKGKNISFSDALLRAQINPNEEFKMRRLCLVPGAEKSQSDSIWKVAAELVEEVGILKTRGKYETATRLSKLLEAEKGTVGGLEFLSSDDGKSWAKSHLLARDTWTRPTARASKLQEGIVTNQLRRQPGAQVIWEDKKGPPKEAINAQIQRDHFVTSTLSTFGSMPSREEASAIQPTPHQPSPSQSEKHTNAE